MLTVTKTIRKKLIDDQSFRLRVATELEVSENTVRYLAKEKSDNLTKYAAVQVYLEEGFDLQNMFERFTKKSRKHSA